MLPFKDGLERTKLNTLVMFPINGLDMRQHVQKCGLVALQQRPKTFSWKLKPPASADAADEFLYDLYAVCNHYGSMQGGHYTGKCGTVQDRATSMALRRTGVSYVADMLTFDQIPSLIV